MSRIRFMSPYLKGGRDSARRSNRVRYLATRPGVELLPDERGDLPATKKQQDYIQRLLRDFPESKELLEYEDYLAQPTRTNASDLIQQVHEEYVAAMSQKENYLDYISHRPGAERLGDHGLWDANGKVANLSQAIREVAEHPGNVWTPVVAIRREDAERLGYTTAADWQALVQSCVCDIARGYKIQPDHLRWYAAFHQKENSVHIHMVIFSSDPKEGFLTKQGIRDVKAAFAQQIFQQDLLHVYEQKTEYRNTLQQDAGERMAELIVQMQRGDAANEHLAAFTEELARMLQATKGKKVYGYLPPRVKSVVDAIVDELARDVRVAAAYDLWNQMREETCRIYSETLPERLPLSRQKAFKSVRNMVIREALRLTLDGIQTPAEREGISAQSTGTGGYTTGYVLRQAGANHAAASTAAEAVLRMFDAMGRIFEDNCKEDTLYRGLQIDRKRRRKLREWKRARGIKSDGEELELR